jgi:hypothetical protein
MQQRAPQAPQKGFCSFAPELRLPPPRGPARSDQWSYKNKFACSIYSSNTRDLVNARSTCYYQSQNQFPKRHSPFKKLVNDYSTERGYMDPAMGSKNGKLPSGCVFAASIHFMLCNIEKHEFIFIHYSKRLSNMAASAPPVVLAAARRLSGLLPPLASSTSQHLAIGPAAAVLGANRAATTAAPGPQQQSRRLGGGGGGGAAAFAPRRHHSAIAAAAAACLPTGGFHAAQLPASGPSCHLDQQARRRYHSGYGDGACWRPCLCGFGRAVRGHLRLLRRPSRCVVATNCSPARPLPCCCCGGCRSPRVIADSRRSSSH